jgi:hypothetical protein
MNFPPEKMKIETARRAVLRLLELGQAGARHPHLAVRYNKIPLAQHSYRRKSP